MVFDIQRFALNDGPGIRTTVFLKGCPLRCLWCHNPESQSHDVEYSFDYELCRVCLDSGHTCELGVKRALNRQALMHDPSAISMDEIDKCPYDAVKVIGRLRNVDETLKDVAKDREYYERSGGGLTVSGGEPLAQFPFTLSLLRKAKELSLHTCLDTTGFAPKKLLQEVLPYTNLFLYDYKETNPEKHRQLTGVSNETILENLKFLYEQGARIILRCPVVPGLNDTLDHLAGITRLTERYPGLAGVEIMAYHDMGYHKAERIGKKAAMQYQPTVSESVKADWLDTLHRLGCKQARLG